MKTALKRAAMRRKKKKKKLSKKEEKDGKKKKKKKKKGECNHLSIFFKKWAKPSLFFIYFQSFQTNNTIFYNKSM